MVDGMVRVYMIAAVAKALNSTVANIMGKTVFMKLLLFKLVFLLSL